MNVDLLRAQLRERAGKQFVRALHEVGAAGAFDRSRRAAQGLARQRRRELTTHYEQVSSSSTKTTYRSTSYGCSKVVWSTIWRRRSKPTWRSLAAISTEACGIPGTSVHTTYLARDKPAMKETLAPPAFRAPARPDRRSGQDVRDLRHRHQIPIIIKPAAGAGASGPSGSTRPTTTTRRSPGAASTMASRSPSRSSSTATRGSTTRSPSTATSPSTSSPTTTPTSSKRSGRGGYRHSSSRPTGSMARPTASCVCSASGSSPLSASGRRRPTWNGSPGPRVSTF